MDATSFEHFRYGCCEMEFRHTSLNVYLLLQCLQCNCCKCMQQWHAFKDNNSLLEECTECSNCHWGSCYFLFKFIQIVSRGTKGDTNRTAVVSTISSFVLV
jgi:hypothetical protein